MADRHRFGGAELSDRTSPLSLHAAAQSATLSAPDQGILPAARTALLRGEPGWLLCPGPAPSQSRRQDAPLHDRAVLKAWASPHSRSGEYDHLPRASQQSAVLRQVNGLVTT